MLSSVANAYFGCNKHDFRFKSTYFCFVLCVCMCSFVFVTAYFLLSWDIFLFCFCLCFCLSCWLFVGSNLCFFFFSALRYDFIGHRWCCSCRRRSWLTAFHNHRCFASSSPCKGRASVRMHQHQGLHRIIEKKRKIEMDFSSIENRYSLVTNTTKFIKRLVLQGNIYDNIYVNYIWEHASGGDDKWYICNRFKQMYACSVGLKCIFPQGKSILYINV